MFMCVKNVTTTVRYSKCSGDKSTMFSFEIMWSMSVLGVLLITVFRVIMLIITTAPERSLSTSPGSLHQLRVTSL